MRYRLAAYQHNQSRGTVGASQEPGEGVMLQQNVPPRSQLLHLSRPDDDEAMNQSKTVASRSETLHALVSEQISV